MIPANGILGTLITIGMQPTRSWSAKMSPINGMLEALRFMLNPQASWQFASAAAKPANRQCADHRMPAYITSMFLAMEADRTGGEDPPLPSNILSDGATDMKITAMIFFGAILVMAISLHAPASDAFALPDQATIMGDLAGIKLAP